jgi:DUF3014 family protein
MSKTVWWLIVIFGVGLVAAIFYYAFPKAQHEPAVQLPPQAAAPAAPPEPETHFPIPQQAQGTVLPPLGDSDTAVKEAFDGLWSARTTASFFHLKDLVRRIVVTIDNLPRQKLALRLMPVKQPAGTFLVTGGGDDLTIRADNAARYASYVRFADAIDAHKLVALYVHFYPLFQQAYQELGYPKGYFNDRLIEVIDHLLAAPQAPLPVKLVRPKVFYEFADRELEERSAGEKILLRMGNDNASRIKAKLRQIRAELIRQTPRP